VSPRQRWAPALRVARREAVRSRGRSILVLVMIALPVLAVTAADVVIQTSEISGTEAIERRIGTADARVSVERGTGHVAQTADPDTGGLSWSGGGRGQGPRTLDDVEDALGREVEAVELVTGGVLVETDAGRGDVAVTETDWTSDLVEGTYRLTEGRMPEQAGEVAINGHLAERGYALGDDLEGEGLRDLTIVGIGENTSYRGHSIAVAQPGLFFGLEVDAQRGHAVFHDLARAVGQEHAIGTVPQGVWRGDAAELGQAFTLAQRTLCHRLLAALGRHGRVAGGVLL